MADVGADMETDDADVIDAETSRTIPFQLQFDKPIPFQIKIAEWNPEKDLLALVTDDSKVLLHRFNWQRLWIISPGKCVTSLCWRPDGKTIALGLDDGSIQLHDVENGKLLRSIKSHGAAVVFLNWEEHAHDMMVDFENDLIYEDRTKRFFPPAPRIPRMPGVSSGDNGFLDDAEDCFQELFTAPHQQFNMLCSGDKHGNICFSIFGIFPIAKVNISGLSFSSMDKCTRYRLLNASVCKLALSKNLCQLLVLSFGKMVEDFSELQSKSLYKDGLHARLDESSTKNGSSGGLHCLLLNTSMFLNRKRELHQVAQQASSIEDLTEVIRASLSVMSKHWSSAMHSFHEKFSSLSSLIVSHGLISNPQDEFLSLLFGARTSPPLHQFLVNSLGEAGLKRVSKAVDSAGKEMHTVIHEHLQPAIEIMGFRLAELRGLSRWRARYQIIGLDEKLTGAAVEKAGMMLVQVERLRRVLTVVLYQFQNFFNWVLRCIKMLLSEPTDQLQPANSELVVIFLKFLFDHDPVGQLLEASHTVVVDEDTLKRLEQLVLFGGFSDTKYLERTLASEFAQLENCLKEAFLMPFTTISQKIQCEDILPLYSIPSSPSFSLSDAPLSVSYYLDNHKISSQDGIETRKLIDYICFRIPDESWNLKNCFAIIRGFTNCSSSSSSSIVKSGTSPEAILLYLSVQYQFVDLSLYKENQLVLLLNEATYTSESPGKSLMLMLPITDLAFLPLSRELPANFWKLHSLRASSLDIDDIHVKGGKVRYIADSVTGPLAVSASRGLACVLSSRRHALVYILDEDEDEASESE